MIVSYNTQTKLFTLQCNEGEEAGNLINALCNYAVGPVLSINIAATLVLRNPRTIAEFDDIFSDRPKLENKRHEDALTLALNIYRAKLLAVS